MSWDGDFHLLVVIITGSIQYCILKSHGWWWVRWCWRWRQQYRRRVLCTRHSCSHFLIYWSAIWVFTGGRAQSARGIPSSVSNNDYGDDGLAYYNQGVEVPTGGWITRDRWYMENQVVYTAEAGHRIGVDGLLARIWAVHGGRDDARNYQVYVVVVTGRGAVGRVNRGIL